MAPQIDRVDQLQPYKSLLLARIQDSATVTELIGDCLDDVEEILELKEEGEAGDEERQRIKINRADPEGTTQGGLDNGFLYYQLRKPVSWTETDEVRDIENHLILLTRKVEIGFLAVYASENSRRRKIRSSFAPSSYEGFQHLTTVDPDRLNKGFFGDTVRTLWLSGMHRRVPVKADAKILSGQSLEYALDPVNDQTFYFTAARSQSDLFGTVGLSPKKSRIWTSRSNNWEEYRSGVAQILGRLDRAADEDESDSPLPVLANLMTEISDLGAPYDVALQPPELLNSDVEEREEREELEEWAYNAHFDVSEDSDSPNVEATLYHRDNEIGSIEIEIDASDPTEVEIEEVQIDPDPRDVNDEDKGKLLKEIKRLCSRTKHMKVYYDSGHTLGGGSLYSIQFRDPEFESFEYGDFSGYDEAEKYDITKEKPDSIEVGEDDTSRTNWAVVGEDNSLFSWVVNNWPDWEQTEDGPEGWLVCDDGSGEIADFIHLREDESEEAPILSLVHVKAAGSENGRISVGKYDKVSSQAVKNLRDLDPSHLSEDLPEEVAQKVEGLDWEEDEDLVWQDGEKASRDDLLDEIRSLGSDHQRRAFVVQPHIRGDYLERKRESDPTSKRLRQLDMILNRAERACQDIGAKFQVVISEE